jgi:hypothetical protein
VWLYDRLEASLDDDAATRHRLLAALLHEVLAPPERELEAAGMTDAQRRTAPDRLHPEKVAYWYFRLNGFFQIENFVVHPRGRGSQRTDADLLGTSMSQTYSAG